MEAAPHSEPLRTPRIKDSRRVSAYSWEIDVETENGSIVQFTVPDHPIVPPKRPLLGSIPSSHVPEWVLQRREELKHMYEQQPESLTDQEVPREA